MSKFLSLPALSNPATAEAILMGLEAIDADGKIVVGTMPENEDNVVYLTTEDTTYRIPYGFHTGNGEVAIKREDISVTPTAEAQKLSVIGEITIAGDANLVPENIVKDVNIFGVTGTFEAGGDAFVPEDASYLFYKGARKDQMSEYMALYKNATVFDHAFDAYPDTSLDLTGIDTSKAESMAEMFAYATMTALDLSPLNTSNVKNMGKFFYYCKSLKTIDLSPLDTSNVEDMNNMFNYCSALTGLDLSQLDTSNVKNMSGMFSGVRFTKLDMSPLDTSSVETMSSIFSGNYLEEITGFSAMGGVDISISFPTGLGFGSNANFKLKRLTFKTDVPEGKYAIRSPINISWCSFTAAALQETLDTITDVSTLGLDEDVTEITITGNPCVTDGSLTDDLRSGFTAKGWTLVE